MPGTLRTMSASSCSRNRPSMSLSILAICSLRAITSARDPALRTLRLASHFVSRVTPARRIAAGVW